ncbi:NRPS-like protein biosynthetic cluster [Penicillium hispanicum]|uniref:NRPS-like protein biosynthetic cluster n=1 Tax=Penicillium hispanicum TaxID=1080232 RepID=UPI0025416AEF|nr:NRPS-like protein biosynthetic cluster [Penicillium hispanicum]KAJ5578641.1 NRPS-like protein biosynthetic cluster [Penicillium hispanicum]
MAIQNRINGFSDDPFFAQILHQAKLWADDWFILDPASSIQVSYGQLLCDVATLGEALTNTLPSEISSALKGPSEQGFYFFLLAPSGYHFLVGFLAILGVGGAAVPLNPDIDPEEAAYLLNHYNAAGIVFTPQLQAAQAAILTDTEKKYGTQPASVQIKIDSRNVSDNIHSILKTDARIVFPSQRPATVMFSSGTTGPPKGIVHTRNFYYAMADPKTTRTCAPRSTSFSYRGMSWTGGFRPIMHCLLGGSRIEFINDRPVSAATLWERLREQGITTLTLGAMMFTRMKEYYEETLLSLPTCELEEYASAVRALHLACSVGGSVTKPVQKFWRDMLGNRSLQVFYATTEAAPITYQPFGANDDSNERLIGIPCHGMEVKLSCGDHGEILAKGPYIFSGYYNDEDKTRAAFDDQGYYKTGDLGYWNGKSFVIEGRASTDIIDSSGFRVVGPELRDSIISLPYIEDAYVLSIPDAEIRSRVGALLKVKGDEKQRSSISLHKLRTDLAVNLATYKLPTVLRILTDDEQLPMTASNRLKIPDALKLYFPQTVNERVQDLPVQVEVCDFTEGACDRPARQWEWSGMPTDLVSKKS